MPHSAPDIFRRSAFGFALLLLTVALPAAADRVELAARARVESAPDRGDWQVVERPLTWDTAKTAIVVCDMWDRHWCQGATARVAEMAPRMNEVLTAARARGVLIVHAPSETMGFYADWPQRKAAQQSSKVADAANAWRALDRAKEPPLPIDDADGGCDDTPACPQGMPWKRQIATLEIGPNDIISDHGVEIASVFAQRGIRNVILMGVHANMCVLGRPFGIRSLVGQGFNVVLMRDLTDTMYSSRARPRVPHFTGTDLVVEHVEKHWCPTITSADLIGGQRFRFHSDRRSTVAIVIGENEYRTWETLPHFAQTELAPRGFRAVLVMSGTNTADTHFAEFGALAEADVVVVSARRRTPPRAMLDLLQAHLDAGRPLLGIRTASHAFAARGPEKERLPQHPELAEWADFDAAVLGGNYQGHHGAGQPVKLSVAGGAAAHPILAGIDLSGWTGGGSLYRNSPLQSGTQVLLMGIQGAELPEPVAWTHAYGPKAARVFYTSLGHVDDFQDPRFRRLLVNALGWGLQRALPE